jgi:uncharacterized protein
MKSARLSPLVSRRRALGLLAGVPALALWPRRARAEAPRILMIGSSTMAGGFGLYLGQDLEREHGCVIDRRGKPSTGLARPDFYDWVEAGAAARKEFRPDVVLCLFGGNDGQGLYMGRRAAEEWIRWGEPGWIPEYRRRVNAFADAVAPSSERLVWIGMQQVRAQQLRERVQIMNGVFETEMALRPNARYVDTWAALSDDGKYSDHMTVAGKRSRVRIGDGVHVTPSGAHVLADFVRPHVIAVLGLA